MTFCAIMSIIGYSEPDAGTDTSRITTRADPDGNGGWKVTGQKVFARDFAAFGHQGPAFAAARATTGLVWAPSAL